MLNKNVLTAVLALQVLLTAALFFTHNSAGSSQSAKPLLGFATTEVNKIVIADGKTTATLGKTGEHWQLGSTTVPASDGKITSLLDSLSKLTTRWPVASTASGRERFEVSDDKYQRHLSLYDGDKLLGEYFFGTSPGFRQTHLRRAGENDVYALAFNNFDLPAGPNDWLDHSLLQVAADHIQGSDYELVKQGDSWQLSAAATPDATALDADKATALATALQMLQAQKVAETVPAGESRTVKATAGDKSYEFTFTKADGNYYAKRSDREQSFTVNADAYDKIAALTRSGLLQAAPVPPQAAKPVPAVKTKK